MFSKISLPMNVETIDKDDNNHNKTYSANILARHENLRRMRTERKHVREFRFMRVLRCPIRVGIRYGDSIRPRSNNEFRSTALVHFFYDRRHKLIKFAPIHERK